MLNVVVVLVEPETPGNVGFAARVMANFGVSELRIAGRDLRTEPEAKVFSVHAIDVLESARVFTDLESALEDLEATWAATARAGRNHSVTRAVVPLEDLPNPLALEGKVGLVFGRESNGLTNEEIGLCDLAFTIPTSDQYSSLNLSHAVAVVLYDLFSRYAPKREKEFTEARAATRDERERVCMHFDAIIDHLNVKEHKKPIAKQVFRNLLGRAYMTGREVTTMTGVVRKLHEKLEESESDKN
ncbi:MAG: RNA methyltransferase [Candidatus Thorarchaeota archaeon]